jgi:hypothetical protein
LPGRGTARRVCWVLQDIYEVSKKFDCQYFPEDADGGELATTYTYVDTGKATSIPTELAINNEIDR